MSVSASLQSMLTYVAKPSKARFRDALTLNSCVTAHPEVSFPRGHVQQGKYLMWVIIGDDL